jgi:hypothetical protein
MVRASLPLIFLSLLLLASCASEGETPTDSVDMPRVINAKEVADRDPAATAATERRLAERVEVRLALRVNQLADWLRRDVDLDALLAVSAVEHHWLDEVSYSSVHPEPLGDILHKMLQPIGMRYQVRHGIIYLESAISN